MHKRLFIAFSLPAEQELFLQSLQQQLLGKGITLTKSFHCTLHFLGDTNNTSIPLMREQLSIVKQNSFETRFSKISAFPSLESPRTIWIGFSPENTIKELHKKIITALSFTKHYNSFVPHLTLAKIKPTVDANALQQSLSLLTSPQKTSPFMVNSFALYQSELRREGPKHEILQTYNLL